MLCIIIRNHAWEFEFGLLILHISFLVIVAVAFWLAFQNNEHILHPVHYIHLLIYSLTRTHSQTQTDI